MSARADSGCTWPGGHVGVSRFKGHREPAASVTVSRRDSLVGYMTISLGGGDRAVTQSVNRSQLYGARSPRFAFERLLLLTANSLSFPLIGVGNPARCEGHHRKRRPCVRGVVCPVRVQRPGVPATGFTLVGFEPGHAPP